MIESQKALASHAGYVDDELLQDDEDFEFPSDQRYEEIKKGDIHIADLQRIPFTVGTQADGSPRIARRQSVAVASAR